MPARAASVARTVLHSCNAYFALDNKFKELLWLETVGVAPFACKKVAAYMPPGEYKKQRVGLKGGGAR